MSSLTLENLNSSDLSVTALNTDTSSNYDYTKDTIHEIYIRTESGDVMFGVQDSVFTSGSANVSKTINATNYKGIMLVSVSVNFANKSITVTLNLKEMGAQDNVSNRGKMTVIAVR